MVYRNRLLSLCGSSFRIGTTGTGELPNLTPVTCCTICRKWTGQPLKVVSNGLLSLCGSGFRIGTTGTGELPNLTPVTWCTICRKLDGSAVMKVVSDRFVARDFRFETFPPAAGIALLWRLGAVSGSEPQEGEMESIAKVSALTPESDFWRALGLGIAREAGEIQESARRR
ncbi:hypothetical protein SLA2020_267640 [Shorea laevis]